MARSSAATVLKDLITELRLWRSSPSRRERIRARPASQEHPDPTPVEIPIKYQTPPTLAEQIQAAVRNEVSQAASAAGYGTFEEEDDYDVEPDDVFPLGAYDVTEYDMPPETIVEDAAPPAEPPPPEAETPALPVDPNEQ